MFTAIYVLSFVCAGLVITTIYLYMQVKSLMNLAEANIYLRTKIEKGTNRDREQLITVSKLTADNHKRLNEVVELVKKLDGALKNYVQDKNKRLGANQKIK